MKKFILCFALTILMGCASSTYKGGAPIVYEDINHPIGDTAVLAAIGKTSNSVGQILQVDGNDTSCWVAGCPSCVRVLPGDHSFNINYLVHSNGISRTKSGRAEVEVLNMEAGHIYVLEYRVKEDNFSIVPKDVGDMPFFQQELDLRGVNVTCGSPITFTEETTN